MNKLVIVGNGFDLAHGLPTSYKHFINDFWNNLQTRFEEVETKEILYVDPSYTGLVGSFKDFNEFLKNLDSESTRHNYTYDKTEIKITSQNTYGERATRFEFKNKFFKEINTKPSENWVDIENEYYETLKLIAKRKISSYSGSREEEEKKQILQNKKSVLKLNREFEQVKYLFEQYLSKVLQEHQNFIKFEEGNRNWTEIYKILEPISIFNIEESKFLREFNKREDISEIKKLFSGQKKDGTVDTESHFLNFNYTQSLVLYKHHLDRAERITEINHIHGMLQNFKNEINFGFGDEMDEDYKLIENLNDNEYLRNFKSFKYSQNSNYQNLLRFIESGKFQVYILGHSCGLSDRTMLNTIFESEYCRSIKVYFHQKDDGMDNFTEIVQNISRHFNDKKKMREKIVNKSLCKPLPQEMRFQERLK